MKHRAIVRASLLFGLATVLALGLPGSFPFHSGPLLPPAHAASQQNLTRYVNPFIGTNPCPGCNYGYSLNTGDGHSASSWATGESDAPPSFPPASGSSFND